MITSKDVRVELKAAKVIVDDPEAKMEDKIKALLKIMEVSIKIGLSTRVSLVKTMEKLGVEKVKPRVRDDKDKKKEE